MKATCCLLLACFVVLALCSSELVVDFQVDAGGSPLLSDNSVAFIRAVNYTQTHSYQGAFVIYVPPGVYNFTKAVACGNCRFLGAGASASIFQWTTQLGSGVPAWDLSGGAMSAWVRDMGLRTSFGRPALGTFKANFDGLRLNGQIGIRNVELQYFYSGLVWNSGGGHTTQKAVHSTNNYYGLFVQNSRGDNYFAEGGLEGNTMASIGIPLGGQLGGGDTIYRSTLCHSPYGLYQEGPVGYVPTNGLAADLHFNLARFERCGNGAFFSNYGSIYDCEFLQPGFSWGPEFRLPSLPRNYSLSIGGGAYRINRYLGGVYPLLAGDTGILKALRGSTFYSNSLVQVAVDAVPIRPST